MGWTDIGVLGPGKRAHVIAVDGNPLDDVRALGRVVLVVREGEIVKNEAGRGSPLASGQRAVCDTRT